LAEEHFDLAAMSFFPNRAACGAHRSHGVRVLAGLAVLLAHCAPDSRDHGDMSRSVGYTDSLRVELINVPGELASGERDSLPDVVYTGRLARIAVTLTDSEYGVPVVGVQVAAKVIATTWIGPRWRLEPKDPRSGVHEGSLGIPTHGPYRIDIEVEVPGGRTYFQFGFDY
jgi:hypothetical protein